MTPRPRKAPPAARHGAVPRRSTAPRATAGLGGDRVEGRRAVLEALLARRRQVRRVFVAEAQEPSELLDAIEEEARRGRVPLAVVSRARLDKEAATEGHQGVVCVCAPLPEARLSDLAAPDAASPAFLLVCDGVTDPRNLGALLRSAECAGATGAVVPRHRAARLTPAAMKAAAGAAEHIPVAPVGGVPAALSELRDLGVLVVGLAPEARTPLYGADLTGPVALVVGGEERGLASLTRRRCDVICAIPQRGTTASLNASVAGAIAVFEVARQRAARG